MCRVGSHLVSLHIQAFSSCSCIVARCRSPTAAPRSADVRSPTTLWLDCSLLSSVAPALSSISLRLLSASLSSLWYLQDLSNQSSTHCTLPTIWPTALPTVPMCGITIWPTVWSRRTCSVAIVLLSNCLVETEAPSCLCPHCRSHRRHQNHRHRNHCQESVAHPAACTTRSLLVTEPEKQQDHDRTNLGLLK